MNSLLSFDWFVAHMKWAKRPRAFFCCFVDSIICTSTVNCCSSWVCCVLWSMALSMFVLCGCSPSESEVRILVTRYTLTGSETPTEGKHSHTHTHKTSYAVSNSNWCRSKIDNNICNQNNNVIIRQPYIKYMYFMCYVHVSYSTMYQLILECKCRYLS